MSRTWAALAFAMVFPTLFAWVYFVALAGSPAAAGSPSAHPPAGNFAAVAAYAGGKVIQFAFPLFWVVAVERRTLRCTRPRGAGLPLGLAFGLLAGAGGLGLFQILRHHSGYFPLAAASAQVRAKMGQFYLGTPAAFIAFGLFLSVIHSFLEEYYWRWFVFGELRQLTSLGPALLLSSLAFMAHHVIDLAVFFRGHFWGAVVPLSLCVGAGGAFWAWLYHRTAALYAPWVSHLLVDAAIMAMGYEMVFGYGR